MKKILFVTYGGGHVNMVVPVIKELQKKDDFDIVVLGLTTAGSVLKGNNIPYIGFRDLLGVNDNALKWGKRLVDKNNESNLVSYEESIAYMGLSYVDLEVEHGIRKAAKLYKKYGRQIFNPVTTIQKLLNLECPDLVIATNSPRAERTAIKVANNNNIKSICLVDLFALRESEWIAENNFADCICVISETVKNNFILLGRNSEDIHVTGNPAFDDMKLICNLDTREEFRRRKKWKNSNIILWASSGVEPEQHPFHHQKGDVNLPKNIMKKMCDFIFNNPTFRLVVRLHPGEELEEKLLLDRVEYSTVNEDNFNELLVSSDVVVVTSSTAGYQAALLDKPLINIGMSVFSQDMPYDEYFNSIKVNDLSLLDSAIHQAVGQKICNNLNMEPSTKNIINQITKVINEKN
jgi:hypothetical protein